MNKDPGDISEFYNGLTGSCGPTAFEEACAANDGRKASQAQMAAVVKTMAAKEWASSNGVTTLAKLGAMARYDGYRVILEWDYSDSHLTNTENWHQVLLNNAGKYPVILFVTNGQALKDVETGAHDEVGLHGHFITVLDKQTDGYRCSDGDNPQARVGKYCIYSYQTLINAQVNGVLVMGPKGKAVADRDWPGIGSGIRAELNKRNLPDTYTVMLAEKDGVFPGREDEIFTVVGNNEDDLIVGWNKKQGRVELNWGGHALVTLHAYTQSLEAKVADLEAKLAAATSSSAVPASLHTAISDIINATQPFADANVVARQVAKDMGY